VTPVQCVRRLKEALEQPFWSTLHPDLAARLWQALGRPGAPLSKRPTNKLVVRERRGAAPRPDACTAPAAVILAYQAGPWRLQSSPRSLPQVRLRTPARCGGSGCRASP